MLSSIYSKIMWPLLPNGVYCFNYHRIGDEGKSQFDPNVFSCTAEQFEQHVKFYNTNFTVISIEQLIEKFDTHNDSPIDKKYAVITFDDGYIDNYSIAFPILKKYNTAAAFYIVTGYLENSYIPWWDEIAWIVRHSNKTIIKLSNWPNEIDISTGTTTEKVRNILREIKIDCSLSMAEKITELKAACQCDIPEKIRKSQLFVNWKQITEMSDNGMHIGSHSMSHNILSHLTTQEQEHEVSQSKLRIEKKLNKEITSFAYPVGNKSSFTKHTIKATKAANYKLAFSFIPGVILSFSEDRYQLKRLPVNGNCSIKQLKNIIVRNK